MIVILESNARDIAVRFSLEKPRGVSSGSG